MPPLTPVYRLLLYNRGMANNLPQQLTSFIGREQQIAEVARHLETARLLTLTGTGGCGKTRLALAVAAALQERFPQGVHFVALAALTDPALVIPTIAATFGLKEVGGLSLLASLKQRLREGQTLLVLDNFEQVTSAAPEIGALLAAADGLRVLVTSRACLHLYGEQEFPVPPLALPGEADAETDALADAEAVRLFRARALQVKPDFALTPESAEAVASVCRRLDGLPLAIELAAARSKILSPQAMLARLTEATPAPALALLTVGAADRPPRQQTLRGAIGWSYDLLPPDQQALFRRLSVFAGGCTLDAVGGAQLDALSALVDVNLLTQREGFDGEAGFSMLQTIREYAQERLDESGQAGAVRRAHTVYYIELVEAAEPMLRGPRQVQALERLAVEDDNLRAAFGWSLEHDVGAALRLGGVLGWYWHLRGYFTEGRGRLEQALSKSDPSERTPARALALNWAGVLAYRQSDLPAARRLLEESTATFRELGDPQGLAYSLSVFGLVVLLAGEPDRARLLLEESAELFRADGNKWGAALSFRNLSEVARLRGDTEAHRALVEESVALFRAVGDSWGLALALNSLGEISAASGEHAAAASDFVESMALFRALGDRQGIASGLAALGGAATGLGHTQEAAVLLGAAAAMLESIGARLDPVNSAAYEQNIAAVRAHLAPSDWDKSWAAGHALTLEGALNLAAAIAHPQTTQNSAAPGLTPRETEVLRLLASGHTDSQIAAALFLSPRTVQTHVRSIYSKLAITTRSAATRYAIEHNLG
ncbi:MAG: LuxR C-terminal-related transcriptional regulator [Chloroflexia bacterium]